MTDLRQLHFRFRTDAGTADASPTWGAGEDVNYYPGTANFRLRIGLRNASTVVAATPWELYVSRNGDAYTPVTTTIAKGVQSVDAGASTDDTAVLIPRLYPFTTDWILSGAAIDLDFAGSRIYPGASFTDYLSISRASTGYAKTASGTLTSFSTNTLRITDAGLLIEDARTNLPLWSQDHTNVQWGNTPANITITANATTGPDGTTTADKLAETATTSFKVVFQGVTVVNTSTYTSSVFAKAAERNWIAIDLEDTANHRTWFDLQNGVVGTNAAGNTAVIEAYGSGWYRCSVSRAISGTTAYAEQFIASGDNVGSYAGTIGNGIYIWGSQLELGTFPSSYIPTTTTSVTRAADNVTCIGSLNTITAATDFSAVMAMSAHTASAGNAILGWATGSTRLRYGGTTDQIDLIDSTSSVNSPTANLGSGTWDTGDTKVGMSVSNTPTKSLVANNGTLVTNAFALGHVGPATIMQWQTTQYPYNYCERLTVWNSKIADATLKALTAP